MKKNTFEINGTKYEGIPAKTMELILDVLSPYVVEKEKPASAEEQLEALRPKNKSVSAKKTDDNFDRATYSALAKELGCGTKKGGCWVACRPWVYAVMNGTMTKAEAKKNVQKYAKAQGWTKKK